MNYQDTLGIDALVSLLIDHLSVPTRDSVANFYFAIDHCFAIKVVRILCKKSNIEIYINLATLTLTHPHVHSHVHSHVRVFSGPRNSVDRDGAQRVPPFPFFCFLLSVIRYLLSVICCFVLFSLCSSCSLSSLGSLTAPCLSLVDPCNSIT